MPGPRALRCAPSAGSVQSHSPAKTGGVATRSAQSTTMPLMVSETIAVTLSGRQRFGAESAGIAPPTGHGTGESILRAVATPRRVDLDGHGTCERGNLAF